MPDPVRSFCIFCDVLGYADEVGKLTSEAEVMPVWNKFKDKVIAAKTILEGKSEDEFSGKSFTLSMFSDNIAIQHPVISWHKEDEFASIIFDLCDFLYGLARSGYFIRGGWSLGLLTIHDGIVFGPGLVSSYVIESKIAVNPRIVLSEEMVDVLKRQYAFYATPEIAPQRHQIWIDQDGKWFVNYLFAAILDHEIDLEGIKEHKLIIEQRLSQFEKDLKVWSKYHWLASYHNAFCKIHKIPLLIPSEKLSLKITRFS